METSVIKLKSVVENTNLPVLGDDGIVYDYFLARYKEKMDAIGYTLTNVEHAALSDFLAKGRSHGWINCVKYFMPFIGSSDYLLAGIVPLIDTIADYELARDSMTATYYTIDNGKIIAVGNPSLPSSSVIALPIKTTDFSYTGLSVFINLNYTQSQLSSFNFGAGVSAREGSGDSLANKLHYRIGASGDNRFKLYSYGSEDDHVYNLFDDAIATPSQINGFVAEYIKNAQLMRKSYAIVKGQSAPLKNVMTEESITYSDFTIGDYGIVIGAKSTTIRNPINIIAFLDPQTTDINVISEFSKDVFALTTALGRDIPTT